MTECPNPDCKKVVDGHGHTLYGEDGRGGLVQGEHETKACLNKKVSRKGMITTIVLVILSLIGSACIVTVYALDSIKQDRAIVTENKENIATMDAKLEYLEVMVEENHNNLEDIKTQIEKVYITPKDLGKLIEDAVKKGNEP